MRKVRTNRQLVTLRVVEVGHQRVLSAAAVINWWLQNSPRLYGATAGGFVYGWLVPRCGVTSRRAGTLLRSRRIERRAGTPTQEMKSRPGKNQSFGGVGIHGTFPVGVSRSIRDAAPRHVCGPLSRQGPPGRRGSGSPGRKARQNTWRYGVAERPWVGGRSEKGRPLFSEDRAASRCLHF